MGSTSSLAFGFITRFKSYKPIYGNRRTVWRRPVHWRPVMSWAALAHLCLPDDVRVTGSFPRKQPSQPLPHAGAADVASL